MRGEARRGQLGEDTKSPYYEKRKYPEPTICPNCQLVYRKGHWTTNTVESLKPKILKSINKELCTACRRLADRLPGGVIYLSGRYFAENGEEIMNIARNQEKQVRASRPLQRIMWTKKDGQKVEIATTNFHLARRIGQAIHSAHGGTLDIKYSEGDRFVRVYWSRE